jgi:hypothetical protein
VAVMTLGRPPHRARGGHDLLIRRSGQVVQDRPLRSVCWADIPQLSARDRHCPAAWKQLPQNSFDLRPSAFQTSCHCRDARGWMKLPAGAPASPDDRRQACQRGVARVGPATDTCDDSTRWPNGQGVSSQAGYIPSWRGSRECYALSPVAAVSGWLLLLLSPLLSAAGPVPHFRGLPADDSVTPWSSPHLPACFRQPGRALSCPSPLPRTR